MSALTRRSLLGGLVAAPAVVSAAGLMPVKLWVPPPSRPSPTYHHLGDIVFNTNPQSGGPLMWLCTEGGLTGKWAPFGVLA